MKKTTLKLLQEVAMDDMPASESGGYNGHPSRYRKPQFSREPAASGGQEPFDQTLTLFFDSVDERNQAVGVLKQELRERYESTVDDANSTTSIVLRDASACREAGEMLASYGVNYQHHVDFERKNSEDYFGDDHGDGVKGL